MTKPSGAQILLLLREGLASDWRSLCHQLGQNPDEKNSETFWIAEALQTLVQEGMVDVTGHIDPPSFVFPKGEISLNRKAMTVPEALGLRISEAAKFIPGHSLIVNPVFGVNNVELIDIFVAMPFDEAFFPIYDDHMKNVASDMHLSIRRSDDIFTTKTLMHDIWQCILGASIVIAECTGRNPNVFYEIGIAHTLGKPVILITQNDEDVPTDLRNVRYIKYEYTPRGMKLFEGTLKSTIISSL